MVRLDEDLAAVLLDQVDAAEVADGVGDPGADDVGGHADGGDDEQRVLALGDVEAGEQHRRLGGDRQAGALADHQQEDADQAQLVDDVDGELDERIGYRREEHGAQGSGA